MNKPSIGRIVHFQARPDEQPCPAIITYVHGGNKNDQLEGVALQVFDPFGGTYAMMGIAEGDGPGQWSWPPKV